MKHLTFILILLTTARFTINAQQTDTLRDDRFSIHGQLTVINQYKPAFKVNYSGPNSLLPEEEDKATLTSTLFAGMRLWQGAGLFVNPELAAGSGLSSVLGVASSTNGESYRVGNPAPEISIARLYYREVFGLAGTKTYQKSDFNQLGGTLPDNYLAVTIGKIAITDFFDNNKYSHDPRTQFLSWALMSNGSWDYPANTHGYTPSVVLEYVKSRNELRYAFSLVPMSANGANMNWDIGKASAQTLEYTRHFVWNNRNGAVRLLGYFTTANMGNYQESIALDPQNPSLLDTRKYGRTKLGFTINAEQQINDFMGCFFRAGWDDGNNETWAFTEIDRTLSGGVSMTGEKWKRKDDTWGLAYVVSGLSKPHREYLEAGGDGFILGDSHLNYGLENVAELYYSAEVVKNYLYLSGAYQCIINPGYNQDRRGPVNVFSLRLHVKI